MESVQQSVMIASKPVSDWEVSFGRAIGFGFFVPPFFVLAAFIILLNGGARFFPHLLTLYPLAILMCGPFAAIAAVLCMGLVKMWVQHDITLAALQARCLCVGGLCGAGIVSGLNVFLAAQSSLAVAAGIVGAGCGFFLVRIALIPRTGRISQPAPQAVRTEEEMVTQHTSAILEAIPQQDAPTATSFVGPPEPRAAEAPQISVGTARGLALLGVALVVGLLCEVFLRVYPLGLNILTGVSLLVAALGFLARWQQIALLGQGCWLIGPALFSAASFAWRDSSTLHWINGLALLVLLVLASRYSRSGQMQSLSLSHWAAGAGQSFFRALEGLFVLTASDIEWQSFVRHSRADQYRAVMRGLGMAVPFVLLFGGLFITADATFESLTFAVFQWLEEQLLIHLFSIAVFTWFAAGWLRSALFIGEQDVRLRKRRVGDTPGALEICIVLGVLNLLFVTFVCTQIPYLFGGQERIASTVGLTYATYARRGFFELVSVAVCVLALLLFAHWLFSTQPPGQERLFVRLFRGLAGSLLGLVCVIMLSAAQRMYFYQQVYGLTELRLYATVFMAWLAVICVWFIATVLRDRRQRFAFSLFVSGLATLVILNILNPDALIVRTNMNRVHAQAIVRFDADYASSLSADAVPILLEAWPRLPSDKQRATAKVLLSRWAAPATPDWQTWNWSRAQARHRVTAKQAVLQKAAGQNTYSKRRNP